MENTPEEISIEEQCPHCSGRGSIGNCTCTICDGKGVVLTETGKMILKYLQDSIRLSEH